MESLGLADAMFRQLRAHIANDANAAHGVRVVPQATQGAGGIVQNAVRILRGDDAPNNKSIKERRYKRRARVT